MRKSAKLPRMYYDWDWQLGMNPSGNVPYTPSIPLLYGLRESLNLLMDEGIADVVKRHQRCAWSTFSLSSKNGLQGGVLLALGDHSNLCTACS